jgi:hypothetical protein
MPGTEANTHFRTGGTPPRHTCRAIRNQFRGTNLLIPS